MKASLLITDHDPDLAEAVCRRLVSHGYEVEVATTGLQCQEMLRTFAPTILVLDPQIQWGGGEGILDWLILEEPLMPPMVVLVDGSSESTLLDRLEPWIDVRITRPETPQELLPYVSQLESLAWWSQSPQRSSASVPRKAVHAG